jgi:hypothetical protein
MSGAFLEAKGETKAEAQRKLNEQIRKGRAMGLTEIRGRSMDKVNGKWVGIAWINS